MLSFISVTLSQPPPQPSLRPYLNIPSSICHPFPCPPNLSPFYLRHRFCSPPLPIPSRTSLLSSLPALSSILTSTLFSLFYLHLPSPSFLYSSFPCPIHHLTCTLPLEALSTLPRPCLTSTLLTFHAYFPLLSLSLSLLSPPT